MELDKEQLEAVNLGVNITKRYVAVSGEAGTGKTSIIKMIYEKLNDQGIRVVAAAPTGKAARRIKQATGIDALTFHMLLKYPQPGELDERTGKPFAPGHPKHDRQFPLAFDVVLGDEYAMVPDELHRNLLAALPAGGSIRVFGDMNQLRPIEENKALSAAPSHFERAFIEKRIPTVVLKTIHRTGEGSSIPKNGRLIINGRPPSRYDDYKITMTNDPIEEIVRLARAEPKKWCSLEHQMITPSRKSWVGTDKLNGTLQSVVFQEAQMANSAYQLERHTWDKIPVKIYVGDKVLYGANNYDLKVFNGEIGIVSNITPDGDVVIAFEYGDVVIPPAQHIRNHFGQDIIINPQRDIQLAYAITTHKSQGSEYRDVVYIMNKSVSFMLNRRNLYTGQSRARNNVNIITDHVSLSRSLWLKGDT